MEGAATPAEELECERVQDRSGEGSTASLSSPLLRGSEGRSERGDTGPGPSSSLSTSRETRVGLQGDEGQRKTSTHMTDP